MCLTALFVWCSVLYLVRGEPTNVLDQMNFRYVDNDRGVNITELCNQTACITKCCPKNQILDMISRACVNSANVTRIYNLDYSEVDIYDKNIKQSIIKSSKKIENFTQIYSETWFRGHIVFVVSKLYAPPANEIYILENGILAVRRINYFKQWYVDLATGVFCVEYWTAMLQNGTVPARPKVVMLMIATLAEKSSNTKNTVTAFALLVSCFFLVLVLAVYALLPQLRNLAGMMLMAYVTTFITAIILRAVQVLGTDYGQFHQELCLYIGFIGYYTIIASYTWMNVMSFDIWWTMRGFQKLRQVERHSILVKFGWYSLYGWGAPLMPVLFIIIVEHLDLTHLPNFVKPHFTSQGKCFIQEDERQLYMNGPILITTCINIALFLMTAYNIWRIKTGVSKHSAGESRSNKKDEIRFGIYLKLSLVMGTFWILEVVGSVYKTDSMWWYIPDIFNCLIGLFIFIIFVCKRNIVILLCKRFSVGNKLVQKWQPSDSLTATTRTTRE